ncbi:metal ABC transporter substrate-binding protein [Motilimonas pumila]|uniref:Metal ABC transporter substrate-binding protein n=1 Tax=Motilimonas pumila TaxID=2303987 RepID=A0A418YD28_9GAMM|nr:metal ABC transporter substrate-binding protein [Motilimonas pumila]RJG42437.1 metal ABC transporter substrate-binding protein [Motilimonas pumila]
MFRLIVFVVLLGQVSVVSAEKFKVVTSFTVIADMAAKVAGDAATVESITKPGAEIHNYQVTPGDIRRTQGADLILYNGLNLELWFDKFFAHFKHTPVVVVSQGIKPISIDSGPYLGKPNPHAWMSLTNAIIYVENIRASLALHDPENAAVYSANAKRYIGELEASMQPLKDIIAKVPENKRWLVSSEGAFSYLARDLGLQELYLWPINADAQGTPQQVKAVIDTVKQKQIPVIFSESTVSAKPAQQVARESGIHYGGELYVDSLSDANGPVPSYLALLQVTTQTIAHGLVK